MKKKNIVIVTICAIAVWITVGIIDYSRLQSFERPIFSFIIEPGYEDGGSGKYVGLGYSYDIKGNFMPEDEFPGVTKWTLYLFGVEVESQIRD